MRFLLAAVVCSGCAAQATGGQSETSTDPVRTTVSQAGDALDVTRHTVIHMREFAQEREAVWQALMSAESDVGLPLQSADPAAGVAIYYLQTATPRLAGRHASVWMECGRAPGGAPRVNTYHLTLRLTTTLESVTGGGGTRARVSLLAYARDRGTVADQLPCSSTGELEKRTLTVLAARLGA